VGGVFLGLRTQDMMACPIASAAIVPKISFHGIVVFAATRSQRIGLLLGSKGKSGFFWIHLYQQQLCQRGTNF
jgi:hypothetical protein